MSSYFNYSYPSSGSDETRKDEVEEEMKIIIEKLEKWTITGKGIKQPENASLTNSQGSNDSNGNFPQNKSRLQMNQFYFH